MNHVLYKVLRKKMLRQNFPEANLHIPNLHFGGAGSHIDHLLQAMFLPLVIQDCHLFLNISTQIKRCKELSDFFVFWEGFIHVDKASRKFEIHRIAITYLHFAIQRKSL